MGVMISLPIGILFGLGALLAWGVSEFFAALSSRKTGSVKTFFWSQVISLIVYTSSFVFFFFSLPSISFIEWLLLLIMTITVIGGIFNYYEGFSLGKVAVVSPIVNAWPLVTLFFALTVLRQTLTFAQMIAVLLVIFGGLLVSFKLSDLAKLKFKNSARGVRHAIIGSLFFGIAFTLLDPLVTSLGFFIPVFLQKVIQIPLSFGYIKMKGADISFPKEAALPIVLIGILEFSGVVTYNLAISSEYTVLIAPLMSAIPMVTIILARLFFKEALTVNQWVGFVFIISGLALLSL
ncbi:MAG TPA: DMT family transporter [candidate division WWE3 bacterium]|uniref:DMT family transporter n=1 Tax=candidate division WWE3 bacterium TaxID=2053526 RepID=A0A7V5IZV3_UNCKA|nr:DMT family transporter [candidate division WWE3 bacterium]